MATNIPQYRLATKNKVGAVTLFGPYMPMQVASKKRQEIADMGYTVFIINVNAE